MVLAAVCSLCIEMPLRAQIDESILPAMYRTTWNPGIPGGIPADNDPARPAAVWLLSGNPYGGYSVDPSLTGTLKAAAFTSAIQSAINSAGAAATPTQRQIVLLAPGKYFVNAQTYQHSGSQVGIYVDVDNVTIRGSGATTTSIIANTNVATHPFKGYGTLILFGHRYGSSDADFAVQNVTADARKGSTTIQVANASAYVVGDVIQIDHQDGSAVLDPGGAAEFNGKYLWFFDDQYFQRQSTYGPDGPSAGAPAFGNVTDLSSANTNAMNSVPQWRTTVQEDEITAIHGNALTLRDPLNIDFPHSLKPQIWRVIPLNTASIPVGNRWDGLEDIRVAGGNNQWGFPGGAIGFDYMAYSWVENVDADGEYWSSDPTDHPGKYGDNIGMGHCYRCEIIGSYSHGAYDENPGGQSYGICLTSGSTQDLVENNIAINNNKPIVLQNTGGGNVLSYNYVDQSELWNSPTWLESGIDDSHAAFDHNNLIEGNWANNLGADGTHGNTGWNTHFRNYSNGNNSIDPKSDSLHAVGHPGYSGYQAYIGNVLEGGTIYRTTPASQSGTPIYQVGFLGGKIGWDDGYAENTLYVDANWDNVTNGIVWAKGPKTIPNSLYLTSAPAFFKGYTWPWVSPMTGKTYILPAKARYDSGHPFGPSARPRQNRNGDHQSHWRQSPGANGRRGGCQTANSVKAGTSRRIHLIGRP